MIEEMNSTVAVRIRFAGSEAAQTFHMAPRDCAQFHADWRAYLAGSGPRGGEYSCDEADHPLVISLNFSQIAYIEPGKSY